MTCPAHPAVLHSSAMTPPSTCIRLPLLGFLFATAFAASRAKAEPPASGGAVISLESGGFVVTSPDGSRLQLAYPSLLDEAQNVTKPTGATVTGKAAGVEYPQGVKLAVEAQGSAFTLHFTGLIKSSHAFRMEMSLPESFKNGGTWQLKGQDAKPFPRSSTANSSSSKASPVQ